MANEGRIKLPKFVRKYVDDLKIKWPVDCAFMESPGIGAAVSTQKKRHTIYVNYADFIAKSIAKGSWLHELCHISLAENVDISFSTSFFAEKHNLSLNSVDVKGYKNGGEFLLDINPKNRSNDNIFYDFQDIYVGSVEFWVDEEMIRKLGGNILHQRMEKYFQRFESRERFNNSATMRRRSIMINAEVLALCSRWKIKSPESIDLKAFFEPKEIEILRELIAHKEKLPQLSYKKKIDLKLLESEMHYMSSFFNMKIKPQFREERGNTVWALD